MTPVIMLLYLIDVTCVCHLGQCIDHTGKRHEIGIGSEGPKITFEVTHIDSIEPDQSGEQPNVRFRELVSNQITTMREMGLEKI